MTKEQIKERLSSSLSANWDRVKDSVIGKELIAFGAEVISESADLQDSLVNAFDYTQTDKRGLISMSHVQDVGLSFVRPSYVKLQLNTGMIIRPFGLKYTVGNVSFYNIETVDTNYEVTLYQGALCYMYIRSSLFHPITGYDIRIKPNTIQIPKSKTESMQLYVLGEVIPNSVLVYIRPVPNMILTADRVSAFNHNPEQYRYKPYVMYDGSYAIEFGDGQWGKSLPSATWGAIYWIRPEISDVTPTTTTVAVSTETLSSDYPCTVLEYVRGSLDDIEYARKFYYKEYLQRQAIVSKQQIYEWMNAQIDVLDNSVALINNVVYVYVKPKDPNASEAYYEKYMADLDLYGSLFVEYRVLKGSAVDTTIEIVLQEDVSDDQKQVVQSLLGQLYSYESMKFADVLDTASVQNVLREAGIQAIVYIHGSEQITSTGGVLKLSFAPIRGSLRIYNGDVLIGWDSNGAIYGVNTPPLSVQASTLLVNSYLFGEYYTHGAGKFIGLYRGGTSERGTTYGIDYNGEDLFASKIGTSNGYAVTLDPATNRFGVISLGALTPDSLVMLPYYTKDKTVGEVALYDMPARKSELIIDGIYFYKAVLTDTSGGTLTIGIYTGASGNPDYSRAVSNIGLTSVTSIAGSLLYEDDVYIFLSTGAILFRNIKTYVPGSSSVAVAINGTQLTASDTIESVHVFSEQSYALVINTSGSRSLYYGDVIRVADGLIDFRTKLESPISLDTITYGAVVIRNSTSVVVYDTDGDTNKSIVYAEVFGDSTVDPTVALYNADATSQGSINYETGVILSSYEESKRAEYRAIYAVPTESSYIKYSGDIIWTK